VNLAAARDFSCPEHDLDERANEMSTSERRTVGSRHGGMIGSSVFSLAVAVALTGFPFWLFFSA
jgi:hypothetical protein